MGILPASRPSAGADTVLLAAAHLPAELRRRIKTTLDDLEVPEFVRITLCALVDLSALVTGSDGPVSLHPSPSVRRKPSICRPSLRGQRQAQASLRCRRP